MKPDLEEMLPHARPMILLSDYDEPADDATAITAYAEISARSPFYERSLGGTPAGTALEYMAQTMALCVGFLRRRKNLPPKMGFVLGSRKLEVKIPCFRDGERYRITAECVYTDEEFGSFDCAIHDSAGGVVASATVSAYQPGGDFSPENMKEFT